MKRYLMAGIAALTLGAGFTSCSHDDFEPMTQAEIDKAKYDMAFLNYVGGKISPNQDWGFGTTRALTRGNAGDGDLNNKIWEEYGADKLTNITDDERKAVLAAIDEKTTGQKISEDVVFPWKAYFLQDVISGQNGNWEGAGSNGTSSSSYSFEAYNKGAQCNNPYWKHCSDEEAANYEEVTNSAHLNNYYLLRDGNQTRINETTLMTDMEYGTYEEMKGRQFRWYINCHENLHWSEYIIVTVDGSYYICFDFGCGYPENDKDGHAGKGAEHNDWDYNDWILKISPAGNQPDVWTGTPDDNTGDGDGDGDDDDDDDDDNNTGDDEITYDLRIIAEDLSADAADDFDFNDVVIDVKYGSLAVIEVKAAGGTLPLRLCGNNNWEVHDLFGVDTDCMVNTGASAKGLKGQDGLTAAPLQLDFAVTNPGEAKAIKIEVYKNGDWQELTAETGKPAAKIAVDTTFDWLGERVSIKEAYPNFEDWVKGDFVSSSKWWE